MENIIRENCDLLSKLAGVGVNHCFCILTDHIYRQTTIHTHIYTYGQLKVSNVPLCFLYVSMVIQSTNKGRGFKAV